MKSRSLLLLLAAVLLSGCDGGFSLSARVVDSEGRIIPGAKLEASSRALPESFRMAFDERGCLSLASVVAPGSHDFNVTVVAAGYKTLEFVAPTLEPHAFRMVLARDGQAFNSQALAMDYAQLQDQCSRN